MWSCKRSQAQELVREYSVLCPSFYKIRMETGAPCGEDTDSLAQPPISTASQSIVFIFYTILWTG